jgi:hypothetical protein
MSEHVWDRDACITPSRHKELLKVSALRNIRKCCYSLTNPRTEILRCELMDKFRKFFSSQIIKAGLVAVPIGLCEKFHFTWLSMMSSCRGEQIVDPVFPCIQSVAADDLCQDLKSELYAAGIRHNDTLDSLCLDIYEYCKNISQNMDVAKRTTSDAESDAVQVTDLGSKGASFHFKGISVRISHEHLSKLHALHNSPTNFNSDVFCLLLRYKSLHGGGFQAALPGPVFDVLKRDFGVEMEGFASPLNSRFSCFCSAFPDTDAAFGSLGSFFQFRPRTGSFALNPPFVGDLILRAAEHCELLLHEAADAKRPLSFVIVVGASDAARGHQAWARLCAGAFHSTAEPMLLKVACPSSRFSSLFCLSHSCFFTSILHERLSEPSQSLDVTCHMTQVTEHRYIDGRQHYGRGGLVRVCDTAVFFWQTPAAAAAWPASSASLRRLAAAFRSSAEPAPTGNGDAAVRAGTVEKRRPAAAKRQRDEGRAPEAAYTPPDDRVQRKAARRAERALARAESEAIRQRRREHRLEQRKQRKGNG